MNAPRWTVLILLPDEGPVRWPTFMSWEKADRLASHLFRAGFVLAFPVTVGPHGVCLAPSQVAAN